MAQNATSLNQIAYNLLNTIRGGRSSHSEHIDLEQIKYTINYYRSTLIRRDAERNNFRLRAFEQDLGVLSLSTVDTAEDDNVKSGQQARRTAELPAPIRLKDSEGLTHISCKDKFGETLPLLDSVRRPYQQYSKYTSNRPYACLLNGYLYVFNDITIDNINVRGVFEDPEEVFNFTAENSVDFYDENEPYPISMDMLEGITKGILNGELKIVASTPNDEEADNLQDSNPQPAG